MFASGSTKMGTFPCSPRRTLTFSSIQFETAVQLAYEMHRRYSPDLDTSPLDG